MDLDADGQPIVIEVLNASDFLDFLERRGGLFAMPETGEPAYASPLTINPENVPAAGS